MDYSINERNQYHINEFIIVRLRRERLTGFDCNISCAGSLGQTDRLTLCTELNLARRTPSSEGLANPVRVGAALRSLGNCGGEVGRETYRPPIYVALL